MKRRKKQPWQSRKHPKVSKVPHVVGSDGLPKGLTPEIQALVDAGVLEICETSQEIKKVIIESISKSSMLD